MQQQGGYFTTHLTRKKQESGKTTYKILQLCKSCIPQYWQWHQRKTKICDEVECCETPKLAFKGFLHEYLLITIDIAHFPQY
jgi:hypothetical protein